MIRNPSCEIAQCLANITAWIDWRTLPVLFAVVTQRDRAIFQYYQPFLEQLDHQAVTGEFARWDIGIREHGLTARYGWRERVARCSAQVIVHRAAIEIDFDLFNPDFGAGPALGHALECLWPGKTDPFRVRKGLLKRGMEVPLIGGAK